MASITLLHNDKLQKLFADLNHTSHEVRRYTQGDLPKKRAKDMKELDIKGWYKKKVVKAEASKNVGSGLKDEVAKDADEGEVQGGDDEGL